MMRFRPVIALIVLIAAGGGAAQSVDFSGDVSLQTRWFPESPEFSGQRWGSSGLVVEPTLYWDIAEQASFTFTPLYRYDSADSRRTHADLREAYLLMYGDWGDSFWELRVGFDRVFWGVVELHNLVDVVNQFDLIEHPREEAKLGQPMAYLTVSGGWGTAEWLVLPYHRKRTFAGSGGRFRGSLPLVDDALYESGAEERHVDLAARYSNSIGPLDFGLSAFAGTNREPFFVPALPPGLIPDPATPFIPYYEQIRHFGLDAQLTTGDWLYKLEAIRRSGARNLAGREEDYHAFILGLERNVYAVFGSTVDMVLLAEWHDDSRGSLATNAWANDLFVGVAVTFNDVQSTELTAGILGDLSRSYRALNLGLRRRLSDNWSMRLEAIAQLKVDPLDLTYDVRRDSFLGLDFTYSY
ncbi:MAG: hypothetical protein OXG29_06905 [Gammaproteobacteria bacterium]|nr:hypothetical protein [Gammaproteobacteria bacterium]MCY3989399.1 hypothetical protein [Gammaproteobacteria bacterium]